jgi:heat shock protein HslJ
VCLRRFRSQLRGEAMVRCPVLAVLANGENVRTDQRFSIVALRTVACVISAATCLAIAGCSSQSTASASAPVSSVSSAAPSSAPASAAQGTANPSTTIVGTWGTGKTYTSPEQPFVTFVDGGTWTASDGCNKVQGTWKESAPGTLVVTSGPHTMMACEGAPLPSAVASTHTYKLAGEKLTLFDETGTELVSLVPQAAEAAPAPSPSATSG